MKRRTVPDNTERDARLYWQSLLTSSFTLRGVGLPELSLAFNGWQYRAKRAAVRNVVASVEGMHVLDVGCGTGHWVAFWHSLGARAVSGIDLTQISVDRLRQSFPGDRFETADVTESIPFQGPFDLISGMDVLHHLTSDESYGRALSNLRRVAPAGGRMLLIEPVTFGASRSFLAGTISKARPLTTVREALGAAGWKLVDVRPALWLLNAPVEVHPRVLFVYLDLFWRVLARLVRAELAGQVLGSLIYPLDRLLCNLGWGPTSKVVSSVAR